LCGNIVEEAFMMASEPNRVLTTTSKFLLSLLLASSVALAQSQPTEAPPDQEPPDQAPPAEAQPQPQPQSGWHRFSGPQNQPAPQSNLNYPQDQNQGGAPNDQAPPPPVPARLTLKTGTFVTIRVNQLLSSDRNQAGDAFSATLAKPLMVDGVVVAEPGETIGGRVVEAKKAGLVKGVSRLALELTDLTLVDGQQVPIRTQLSGRNGPTSVGRDAAGVAGATALGAAIGASADWGRGAAIGAGAGAIAGTLGVLLTRGYPTVVTPESLLTFRLDGPVVISTAHAPLAFHYVEPGEYQQASERPLGPRPPAPPCQGYGCAPAPYLYYGAPYYYPYYWGGGFDFWYGPRYYRGGFYYRGYRGYRGYRR
jgi:hypothetical protein